MVRFAVAVGVLLLAGVAVRADDKSHRQAAEELFKAMDVESMLAGAIDASLEAQVKANPALAQFKGVMKKFFNKYMSYASLKDDLIKLYTDEFTEDELKEMTKFYKTPTGRKLAKKGPSLMQKGGQLGMARVQKNTAELQKMIQDSLKGDKP
jgi:hypothetical protein